MKKKCEELERSIFERFNQDKTEKIKFQSIKTANKHLNEKNALKAKAEIELEIIRKEKFEAMEVYVLTL